MQYTVIRFFTDLQDNGFAYNVGDTFPRDGKAVTADRIAELSTCANKQGVPLIEEVRISVETVKADETVKTDKTESVEDEPKKRRGKRKTT